MRWRNGVLAVLLVAATTQAARAGGELAGSEWGLPGGGDIFIQFRTGGELIGFAGCNNFGGRYVDKRYALAIGPLRITRKACAAAVMAREQVIVGALEATRRASGDHLRLKLMDGQDNVLLDLVRRDWD